MDKQISLESLNSIAEIIDNPVVCSPDCSLENMFDTLNLTISDHDGIMRAQSAIKQYWDDNKDTDTIVEVVGHDDGPHQKPKIPSYVNRSATSDYLLTIDMDILFAFVCYEQQPIAKFLKQLSDIPDNGRLIIMAELPFRAISYFQIFDGLAVFNVLNTFKFKKVFHIDSNISLSELMIAMRCDEIVVGDFASLSITKADNATQFGGKITDTYEYVVKSTYDYWINKGLFTAQEVADLYEDEANKPISLLAKEIQGRLKNGPAPVPLRPVTEVE